IRAKFQNCESAVMVHYSLWRKRLRFTLFVLGPLDVAFSCSGRHPPIVASPVVSAAKFHFQSTFYSHVSAVGVFIIGSLGNSNYTIRVPSCDLGIEFCRIVFFIYRLAYNRGWVKCYGLGTFVYFCYLGNGSRSV